MYAIAFIASLVMAIFDAVLILLEDQEFWEPRAVNATLSFGILCKASVA